MRWLVIGGAVGLAALFLSNQYRSTHVSNLEQVSLGNYARRPLSFLEGLGGAVGIYKFPENGASDPAASVASMTPPPPPADPTVIAVRQQHFGVKAAR